MGTVGTHRYGDDCVPPHNPLTDPAAPAIPVARGHDEPCVCGTSFTCFADAHRTRDSLGHDLDDPDPLRDMR